MTDDQQWRFLWHTHDALCREGWQYFDAFIIASEALELKIAKNKVTEVECVI